MNSIAIIDYGVGNLLSVARAFNFFGANVSLVQTPEAIKTAERLILPGVGAFADGMKGLEQHHLVEPIKEFARQGRPFMGICLGMQLMLTKSYEFGEHLGLNLIEGEVISVPKLSADGKAHKIPHIGWNSLRRTQFGSDWETSILQGLNEESSVYFVHSFMANPNCLTKRLADTFYNGQAISAAIQSENIYGCQFHPEKSGEVGLKIIQNFLNL